MSKQTEALKLALETLKQIDEAMPFPVAKLAQKAIREALAEQPAQPQQEPVSLKSLAQKAGINLPETYIPTMDDAIAAGDSVLMNEQAALLRECRAALDSLIAQKPTLAGLLCGSTTLGNLKAELGAYRPQGVFGTSPQPARQEPKKDLMYSTVAMQERHAAFVDRAVATLEQAKREALAEQPAQQEPHCYMDEYGNVHGGYEDWMEHEGGWFPVYTSPPASKPWVGIDAGDWNKIAYTSEFRAGADWAEAKLREKNT